MTDPITVEDESTSNEAIPTTTEDFGQVEPDKVVEDMPLAIREYYEEEKNRDRMEREQGREEYCKEIFGKRYEEYIFLLRKIDECCNRGESSGRQKLLEVCKQQEIFLTEQEIRGMLKKLEDLGFIEVYKGRRGNKISNKGREFLEKLD